MNKKDMIECITKQGNFVKGDKIYYCPDDLGFKHQPCKNSSNCKECWIKAINAEFKADMNFKEYQEKALRTKGTFDHTDDLINGVMGLNGEAGEVIDIVKKHLYQGHELDKDKLIDECGDVLWYLNLIADALGVDLEHIAEYNIEKLERRYPKGHFRKEDSVNRKE